jgi:succinate dehydrogenase/fumarate reductase flavoprotein subunit
MNNKLIHINVDILIIGSRASGLTAVMVAISLGLNTILVEKSSKIGSTTSYSGRTIWIPGNHIAKAHSVIDSKESAMKYLDTAIREPNLESSSARRSSFLDNSPYMVSYLAGLGFKWLFNKPSYPDYYPKLP